MRVWLVRESGSCCGDGARTRGYVDADTKSEAVDKIGVPEMEGNVYYVVEILEHKRSTRHLERSPSDTEHHMIRHWRGE